MDTSYTLPGDIVPAFKLVWNHLEQVREQIKERLAGCPDKSGINQLLGYVNARSGKMLRPGLLLLSGVCCGKVTDEHIRVGAIFEMMHNATLLHDDVIDEACQRRGIATVNKVWGNESAVLLGDYLLSQVFRMCTELDGRIAKLVASAAVRTCWGELSQTVQRQNRQLTEQEYIEIITEKSAALFSSSCLLGSILAGAEEKQTKALSDYGLNVGIAFQITDDLIDIIGDEQKAGKTLGSDVSKKNLTLAMIRVLETAQAQQKEKLLELLEAGDSSSSARDKIADILIRCGSIDYVKSRACGFSERAIKFLNPLPQNKAKEALIEVAHSITQRAD